MTSFVVEIETQWGDFVDKRTVTVNTWDEVPALMVDSSTSAYGEYMYDQRQRDDFLRKLSGE